MSDTVKREKQEKQEKKEQEELIKIKQDINVILNKDINFKQGPNIKINDIYFNTNMTIITSIFIFVWVMIWWLFGFFDLGHYSIIFFFMYIFIGIFNIFTSPLDEELNNQFSRSKYNDSISDVEIFISIIIILYVFIFNMKISDDCKKKIYKVLTVILIFSSLLLCRVNFQDNSNNVKNLIIIQKKINNQIIILFLLCIYLIFICHKKI